MPGPGFFFLLTGHKSSAVAAGGVERVQGQGSDRLIQGEVVIVVLVQEPTDNDAPVGGARAHEFADVVGRDLLDADGVTVRRIPEA